METHCKIVCICAIWAHHGLASKELSGTQGEIAQFFTLEIRFKSLWCDLRDTCACCALEHVTTTSAVVCIEHSTAQPAALEQHDLCELFFLERGTQLAATCKLSLTVSNFTAPYLTPYCCINCSFSFCALVWGQRHRTRFDLHTHSCAYQYTCCCSYCACNLSKDLLCKACTLAAQHEALLTTFLGSNPTDTVTYCIFTTTQQRLQQQQQP
jgi:hypothetical protein